MAKPTVASLNEDLIALRNEIVAPLVREVESLRSQFAEIPGHLRGAATPTGRIPHDRNGSRLNRVTCANRTCHAKSEPMPTEDILAYQAANGPWKCDDHRGSTPAE